MHYLEDINTNFEIQRHERWNFEFPVKLSEFSDPLLTKP